MVQPIYRRFGEALVLRAAVLPVAARPVDWPAIGSPESSRRWLASVWNCDLFVTALRAASPQLVACVERILVDDQVDPKRIQKATSSIAGYVLRATGRPTPFGLFAGVATAREGSAASIIGADHQAVGRPDTLWVDHVRRDLEGRPDVLPFLTVRINDLAVRHGDTLTVPRSGGRIASTRIGRPMAVLLDATEQPTTGSQLMRMLADAGGTPQQAQGLISQALAEGYLTSSLAAPMTRDDPAGHLLRTLVPHRRQLEASTRDVLAQLGQITRTLAAHNQTTGLAARELRETADDLMRRTPASSRSRIALDLRLDAQVRVPARVLNEAERAADAFIRLTRTRGGSSAWATFATHFWERYGVGTLVPVREAVDLAAGLGFPADYPMSLWPQTPPTVLPRDEKLAAKAMHAVVTGDHEVVLTNADIDDLAEGSDVGVVAPHVELGIRIRATDTYALDRGNFLLDVRPAWTAGVLSGRFAQLLGTELSDLYGRLPTMVQGALPVQLSFAPTFPHAENVARIPAALPHVLSVGEHREPAEHVMTVDDLAVLSTGEHLHLVSISRRRVVEPLVLHPLAMEKQAPPLARFLAMLGRAAGTAWTAFDWGPAAAALPVLPRVRYGRSILAPARWKLSAASLPAGPFTKEWHAALTDWAAVWRCPARIELHDDDRTVTLDLAEPAHAHLIHHHLRRHTSAVLTEAASDDELRWLGHAHEITVPLATTGPQLPHPDVTNAPLVTNQDLAHPATTGRWVQAKVFTHPTAMDQIITHRLPGLLSTLHTEKGWFVRYRSVQENDHLRIRVPAGHNTAEAVAAWTERLVADRLASHLVFDSYRPEIGRYGTGTAMDAAEEVFVADSVLAGFALTDLPRLNREVLCALSMIDLAEGFLGTRKGRSWMATTPVHRGEGRPETTRFTVHEVREQRLLNASPRLAVAVAQRRAALGTYRSQVGEQHVEQGLEALLHMLHNRLAGPDRASEATARHTARQACRNLKALGEA
ncbi:lantibiotic dehydratase [Streptomyces sp. NPDC059534]|uniref:lantibiotic dehydratase n=1 Tax=Streptomyces sp. NPDC059534 TaxID=3346859 RepID=UPI0036BE8B8D